MYCHERSKLMIVTYKNHTKIPYQSIKNLSCEITCRSNSLIVLALLSSVKRIKVYSSHVYTSDNFLYCCIPMVSENRYLNLLSYNLLSNIMHIFIMQRLTIKVYRWDYVPCKQNLVHHYSSSSILHISNTISPRNNVQNMFRFFCRNLF